MKKYNLGAICKRANELVKSGVDKSTAFKAAWAEAKSVVTEEANTIAAKARAFKEMQIMIEELQAKQNAIKEAIISEMNGEQEISADIFKIRYITVTSKRLDTTKLKAENSDIYNEYLKESVSQRFTVSA